MTHFAWNTEKNADLIDKRSISFERVIYRIERAGLPDVVNHPNQSKYPNQKMFIVNVSNYAYLVPFVENDVEIFLKTVIPSRKATKKYLEVKNHDYQTKPERKRTSKIIR
jgi:uncharacterized DUF497 family protein